MLSLVFFRRLLPFVYIVYITSRLLLLSGCYFVVVAVIVAFGFVIAFVSVAVVVIVAFSVVVVLNDVILPSLLSFLLSFFDAVVLIFSLLLPSSLLLALC